MTHRRALTGCIAVCFIASLILPGTLPAQEEEPPHWGYEGEHGPVHWADMNEDFALCAEGDAQSPIDVTGATALDLSNIMFHYGETPLAVSNNGHTIQVNVEAGSSISYNARDYELLQFHFHHPSEHTVDGAPAPMELHLVHRAADGDLAVVGVLLTADGDANDAYSPIFDHLPAEAEAVEMTDLTLAIADLLPATTTFTTYSGSLTTPPCSEGVRWLLLNTPVALGEAQVEAFSGLFELNARPVQPLNARDLLEDAGA